MTYRLDAATPVFAVADVARTMAWYEQMLGFTGDPFPKEPPYSFAILNRTDTQIMLRQLCPGEAAPPPSAAWDVYLRVGGQTLPRLWEELRTQAEIVEPFARQFYGDSEFTIRDCDGRQICLSELLPPELSPPLRQE